MFSERRGENSLYSPLKIKKKKFENFLKQLGDSPEKKRNISANSFIYELFLYTSLYLCIIRTL